MFALFEFAYGSSPLARGTFVPRGRKQSDFRFIPARAGNIYHYRFQVPEVPVHPRSRGEHRYWLRFMSNRHGSSPLARGTYPKIWRKLPHIRFIPARAGNIIDQFGICVALTVHPRSRGEHPLKLVVVNVSGGSSPLARGTFRKQKIRAAYKRFIPARAGNI